MCMRGGVINAFKVESWYRCACALLELPTGPATQRRGHSAVFRPVRSLGFCASGKPVHMTKASTPLLDFSLPDNVFGLLRLVSAKGSGVLW